MFNNFKQKDSPIILEGLYRVKNIFQIGSILKVGKKKVYIDYFNARGEFDLKQVSLKHTEITYFRIDSPYSNLFFKYSKRIK